MARVPSAHVWLASCFGNTSLLFSAAIGVALLGTVSADHTRSLLAHGTGLDPALLSGYQLAFRIGAMCVVVALAAAVAFLRSPRQTEEVSVGRGEPALSAETASSS
jgi:hypothetical protein